MTCEVCFRQKRPGFPILWSEGRKFFDKITNTTRIFEAGDFFPLCVKRSLFCDLWWFLSNVETLLFIALFGPPDDSK